MGWDYELGKLAEELIDKRYEDRIKRYEGIINTLKEALEEQKSLLKEYKDTRVFFIRDYNEYQEISGEEVTAKLVANQEKLNKVNKELAEIRSENNCKENKIYSLEREYEWEKKSAESLFEEKKDVIKGFMHYIKSSKLRIHSFTKWLNSGKRFEVSNTYTTIKDKLQKTD